MSDKRGIHRLTNVEKGREELRERVAKVKEVCY